MKKLNRYFYLMLCTFLLASTSVIAQPKLSIVTEFMPPLQLAKSGHKMHGKTAELVSAIVEDSGLLNHIDIFPWARCYLWATTKPNVLIFPIIRTEEREHKFHWIGKVWSFSAQVYRLKSRSDIKATSLKDAKNYSVGVYREDFFHRYLVKQGFKSEQLYAVADIEQSVLLFLNGRTDLIVIDESIFEYYLKKHHHANSEVVSIMRLSDVKTNDAYIALSKNSSPEIIKRITRSYQRISTSETFAEYAKARTVSASANTQ